MWACREVPGLGSEASCPPGWKAAYETSPGNLSFCITCVLTFNICNNLHSPHPQAGPGVSCWGWHEPFCAWNLGTWRGRVPE